MLEERLTPPVVREVLEEYLRGAEAGNTLIAQYAAQPDLGALGREAHSIAGIAGNVGVGRVKELASALEAACRTDQRDAAARLADELLAASKAGAHAVRSWLATRPAELPVGASEKT
jgi:HPt (histidine-containing phosphotransfer) domain-containing protein